MTAAVLGSAITPAPVAPYTTRAEAGGGEGSQPHGCCTPYASSESLRPTDIDAYRDRKERSQTVILIHPWGPGLPPDPFRLSCGCRDQHEGESRWAIPNQHQATMRGNSARQCYGFSHDEMPRSQPTYSANWKTARAKWEQTNGRNMPRGSERLQRTYLTCSFEPPLARITRGSTLFRNSGVDDLAYARFLLGRERRQSAALRRQRARVLCGTHAAAARSTSSPGMPSQGYKSGRSKWREMPNRFSTERTNLAGSRLPRLRSWKMLGVEHPHASASGERPPANLIRSSIAIGAHASGLKLIRPRLSPLYHFVKLSYEARFTFFRYKAP